ncbi:family 20 glycosylhydrolase [Sphingomonas sp. HF-S3]|uniref:beta-N-acetylhexosaminidase n=1 Tax=Sphingomonas rustica TaxID=3103142 RepID=A0ABV0B2Z4_9SPHN
MAVTGWKSLASVLAVSMILAVPSAAALAAESSPGIQADYDRLAREMGVRLEVVDNHPASCPAGAEGCFLTTLSFTMPARLPGGLAADGFAIYFSFVNRLPVTESDVFQHQLINGDLYRLTLKPGARLEPGKRYDIKLWGQGAWHSQAFAMPNLYLTAKGIDARVIAATRPAIDRDTGREYLSYVAPMTDEAKLASRGGDDRTVWQTPERAFAAFAERGAADPADIVILPTPVSARRLGGAAIDLRGGVAPVLNGVTRTEIAAALDALAASGVSMAGRVPMEIRVEAGAGLGTGAYRLTVSNGRIAIVAGDAAGASNAIRSLVQQAMFDRRMLKPIAVEDAPRYGFRGLHIDLARNFHSKEEVLKLIEAMAAYKFNKLHLHLADDEGWRLEIKALPELTEVGSKRCHDPQEQTCLLPQLGAGPDGTGVVNGHLTQADYIEIVRAATARQIEVIPSLDMPGHSRAAIRSMEVRYNRLFAAGRKADAEAYRLVEPGDTTRYRSIQNYDDNTLNVCIDQTYRFLDTAVGEIAAMHAAAGAPLRTFHIGADETAGAWSQSPACKPVMAKTGRDAKALGAYFIERVASDLDRRGLKVAGWSDGLGHTDPKNMPKSVQTNIWATLFTGGITEAHVQANHGWDVVLSVPDIGYLDMPYVPHPEEGGYDWASRSVDTLQVFGFMTDNLPANGALIRDTYSRPQTIEDKTPRDAGRGVTGLQAQLWSETTRTDAGVDYQLFPRLIAFSERAWRKPGWEPAYVAGASYGPGDARVDRGAILADWRRFAGRMPAQFALLDRLKIAYRITPPGARIAGGKLEANSEYPGMAIDYRTGGGAWRTYRGPVAVKGPVELRTRSADGTRASRIVTVR